MRVYLMARYGRRAEMLQVASELEAMGHEVTSRWVRGAHELQDAQLDADPEYREREGARFAMNDLLDMSNADCGIAFTEEPGNSFTRGGRHFEAGFWYSRSFDRLCEARRICVGPVENIFYSFPEWEHYPDWPACRAALEAEAGVTA